MADEMQRPDEMQWPDEMQRLHPKLEVWESCRNIDRASGAHRSLQWDD
jgi:hypothetical protein